MQVYFTILFTSLGEFTIWIPLPRFKPVGLRIQIFLPLKWQAGSWICCCDFSFISQGLESSPISRLVWLTIWSLWVYSSLNTYLKGRSSLLSWLLSISPFEWILMQNVSGSIDLNTACLCSSCQWLIFLKSLFLVVISWCPSKWLTIWANKFWPFLSKFICFDVGAHRKWKWLFACL